MKAHISLFGIPVRFDPTLLFLVGVLGYFWVLQRHGTTMFLIWIPLVIVAILVHELGHALVGRAFGLTPFIVLHGMGGLTSFDARQHRALTHGRRILITLAGPLAGIALGGAVWIAMMFVRVPAGSLIGPLAELTLEITIGWGLLNLIPMLPLDGGHIVATILDKLFGVRGVLFARIASIVLAVGLAGYLVLAFHLEGRPPPLFALFILAALAFNNFRAYQLEKNWQKDAPLEQAIKDAFAALEAGDTARVRALAESIRERAATPQSKAHVSHLLAWAYLIEGDAQRARSALAAFPAGHRPDAFLEGSVLLASGHASDALGPLIEALVDRGEEPIADALGRAAADAGRIDELIGLLEAKDKSERVGAGPFERVAHRLFTSERYELAGDLYERVFARFGQGVDAFNAACAALRVGDRARAVSLLERAIDAGLSDPTILDTDEDVEELRGTAEMEALRKRAGLA